MTVLLRDLRTAVRSLRRSPAFALVIVLTLALGIGANTALFSMVYGVLLRPLPYAGGEELFRLRQGVPAAGVEDAGVSVPELADYRVANRTLSELVEYHSLWFNLLDGDAPVRVLSGVVSQNFFEVLGVRPLLGRTFTPEENRVGAAPVLVLGHAFWQSRFGGDPGVIGRTVEMNDHIHTIVGVLPPLPAYPDANDVWMPWYACPFRAGSGWQEGRDVRAVQVFGRVREGVTLERAERDVERVLGEMRAADPGAYPAAAPLEATLLRLDEELTREARTTLLLLLAVSGLVLLIACANVANLSMAQSAQREQELVVRSAVGAPRGRLVRQLVTESTLLALAGGALGVAGAYLLLDPLVTFGAQFTPRAQEVAIDGGVLAFALAVSLATGVAVGLAPAVGMERDLAGSLRSGAGHASASRRQMRLRRVLVGGQVAVAFALLVGAGLMIRSFAELLRVDPGFDATGVVTARVDLDWAAYDTPERRRAFWRALTDRAGALPGVQTAALSNSVPLDGNTFTNGVLVEGEAVLPGELPPRTAVALATPGYFQTLRIPLHQGRDFRSTDHSDAPPVAIVSRGMARHRWPGRDPLGQRISLDGGRWLTVVGVVGDVREEGLAAEVVDQAYLPLMQSGPLSASLVLRTGGAGAAGGRAITDAVRAIDPRQPVAFVRPLSEVRRDSIASPRLTALLLGLFAAVALAISVAGILGLMAHVVGQRTREIGIRLALGARPGGVAWLIVRQGMTAVVAGLLAGAAGAALGSRTLRELLYRTSPADPATYAAVALVLFAAAAASYLPVRRAMAVDPVVALRE